MYKHCAALILAGGKGTRFGLKKQFMMFHGSELYCHVLHKVLEVVSRKHVVIVGIDVLPGETRSGSVMSGLRALPKDTSRVIILEAARPLVTVEQIEILLNDEAPSSSFVMPLVNTVVGRDGTYFDRSSFYDLLTPQAFDYKLLLEAYETGRYVDMTDETRVMYEAHGIKPHLIETGDNLFKVTYPRDVAILEGMVKERPWLLK